MGDIKEHSRVRDINTNEKIILTTTILLAGSKSVTYWKEVGTGSPPIASLTLSGPNQEYIVQGDKLTYSVYQTNWEDNNNPISSVAKTVNIPPNSNILAESKVQADSGYNVVVSSQTIFRFHSQPGAFEGYEEYNVPKGKGYAYPYWAQQTNYMFVSARAFTNTREMRVYRLHSDRVSDIKVYNTGANSRSYGVLHGTNWLVVSIAGSTQRKLFDYTSGYEGGSNTAVQTQSRADTVELGFVSPEDGRGYFVVATHDFRKTIYTVKNDGTDLLNHQLTSIDTDSLFPKWIKDSDFCVVPSWGTNFAVVNFMDTNKPPPTYYTLQNGGKYIYQPQVWNDYKAIVLSSMHTDISYVYKALTEMPCSDLCATCDGVFRSKCLTCRDPHSSKSGNVCSCNTGYYASNISPTKKECLACSPLCGTCSGNGSTQCNTCRYSYMERKSDGRCGCPDGKYLSGTSCLDCDASCKTCSGPGPSGCLSCDTDKGRYLSGTRCLACDTTCLTCSGLGPLACLSCDTDNYWSLLGTKCIKSCPKVNQYIDGQNNCNDCPKFCQKCTPLTGVCTSCNSTYVLIEPTKVCEKAEKPLVIRDIDYSSRIQTLTISFNQAIIAPSDLNLAHIIQIQHAQNSTSPYRVTHKETSLDESRSKLRIKMDLSKVDVTFVGHRLFVIEA